MTALNRLILASVVFLAPLAHAADLEPAALAKQIKQSTAELVDRIALQEREMSKQQKALDRLEKQVKTQQDKLTAEKARTDTLKADHARALAASRQSLSDATARATVAEKALRTSSAERQTLESKLSRQAAEPAAKVTTSTEQPGVSEPVPVKTPSESKSAAPVSAPVPAAVPGVSRSVPVSPAAVGENPAINKASTADAVKTPEKPVTPRSDGE